MLQNYQLRMLIEVVAVGEDGVGVEEQEITVLALNLRKESSRVVIQE